MLSQPHAVYRFSCLAFLLFLVGCSTLDQLAVGRTDRLKPGKFYVTYDKERVPDPNARIGILPVTVQPNMDDPDLSYLRSNPVLGRLAEAVSHRLERMQVAIPIEDLSYLSESSPQLYVGSSEGDNVPYNAGIERESFEKYPPMIAYLAKGSPAWREQITDLAHAKNVDYIVRVWISFAQYPKSDRGFFGKKVILGTNYESNIRFMSAEDKPVEVLQLSGYVVDRGGNVIRAGAEGVTYIDSPFWVQVLELQKVMDDDKLARVLDDEVRDDLPGRPASLDVALRNLMAQLTNRYL